MKDSSKGAKPAIDSPRIIALETRQAELEKRVAELERAATRQLPAPWTQPVSPCPSAPPVWPPIDDSDNARCHVCHNRFKDMTHYACGHPQCPSRVTCGNPLPPHFTCDGVSSSATTDTVSLPKTAAGPYGALGTICILKPSPIS